MEKYALKESQDSNKNSGKNVALKFDLGELITTRYGITQRRGHFVCLNPFSPINFIKKNEKELADKKVIWEKEITKIGFMQKGDFFYKNFNKLNALTFSTLLIPDKPIQNLKFLFYFLIALFAIDDFFEEVKADENLNKIVKILIEFAQGNSEMILQTHYQTLCARCKLLSPLCKLLTSLHHEARQFNLDTSFFTNSLIQHLYSQQLELNYFLEEKLHPFCKEDYLDTRYFSSGAYITQEVISLIRGIVLSKEIRLHPAFIKYRNEICLHTILVNDIFSLEKEAANEEIFNMIIIKQEKYSLQTAFNKTLDKLNNLVIKIKDSANKLKEIFKDDSNVEKFIKSTFQMVDGNILGHKESKRYGDIAFEVVELPEMVSSKSIFFQYPLKGRYDQESISSVFNSPQTQLNK
ncbi:terpene synthase family protein [Rickettsiella endosymbiont of Rhagonycha lignosa]|uniref:terpene synthase family protein n=1 Tax=Rickettsiella endosymbiont of Rhagonycha lignosa TaxID=3077937 RepID=UPI00313D92FD